MDPTVVTQVSVVFAMLVFGVAIVSAVGAVLWWKEAARFTWLYYGGLALALAALCYRPAAVGGELEPISFPLVLVKWTLLLVGVGVLFYARKRRPGYKANPWEGPGPRGARVLVFLFPACLAWGLGWGASLGGLVFSSLTLDVPAAILSGLAFMSYVGQVPPGC
jgi:hypothetical protein